MNFEDLYNRAMGQDGLSANFSGKKDKDMTTYMNKKTFRMTVKNDTDEALTFALLKGTFPNLEEIRRKYPDVKAVLADGEFYSVGEGDAAKKATCKVGGNSSMAYFQEFFAHGFEGEVEDLELISAEKGNFQEEITAVVSSPFDAVPATGIPLSSFLDPGQFDQNRVLANGIRIPLSPLALVTMTILPRSSVSYTLTINAQSRG